MKARKLSETDKPQLIVFLCIQKVNIKCHGQVWFIWLSRLFIL